MSLVPSSTLPLISRVVLKNFKSIAACKVDLGNICFLVGQNGSGKSNFIDALRLISESLNDNLELAIRNRGGISEVRRRSGGHPTHFTISLRINMDFQRSAFYAISVGTRKDVLEIKREQASISDKNGLYSAYTIESGEITQKTDDLNDIAPRISADRLFLPLVSAKSPFDSLFDHLSKMQFYSINPEVIREPQLIDSGEKLERSGRNLASVLKRMLDENPQTVERICDYMKSIVPGIVDFKPKSFGSRETIEFRQEVLNQPNPWRFYAESMSDGTLRSLGILIGLFNKIEESQTSKNLIAIEEPEITIHPGAASIVLDAVFEVSRKSQIIASTHSPDLLDHEKVLPNYIRSVKNIHGESRISNIDSVAVSAIQDELFTAGELMRQGKLLSTRPPENQILRQSDLFK